MEMTVYNPLKARLETIDIDGFTDKNTTWFDGCTDHNDIYMLTDTGCGLLINQFGYSYPIWVAGKSRAAIDYNQHRAMELVRMHE